MYFTTIITIIDTTWSWHPFETPPHLSYHTCHRCDDHLPLAFDMFFSNMLIGSFHTFTRKIKRRSCSLQLAVARADRVKSHIIISKLPADLRTFKLPYGLTYFQITLRTYVLSFTNHCTRACAETMSNEYHEFHCNPTKEFALCLVMIIYLL